MSPPRTHTVTVLIQRLVYSVSRSKVLMKGAWVSLEASATLLSPAHHGNANLD